jgi:hypothetical protein
LASIRLSKNAVKILCDQIKYFRERAPNNQSPLCEEGLRARFLNMKRLGVDLYEEAVSGDSLVGLGQEVRQA